MMAGALSKRSKRGRPAFTPPEALISLTILGLASATIFLAVDATMTSSMDSLDETIADGLAQQLLDEIAGLPYVEKGTVPSSTLGPEETVSSRSSWDDLDDYHGFVAASPLTDRYNKEMGTGDDDGGVRPAAFQVQNSFFDNWRVTVNVSYVNANNQDQSGVTDFRRVRVTVEKYAKRKGAAAWKTIAAKERVFAYVPPAT